MKKTGFILIIIIFLVNINFINSQEENEIDNKEVIDKGNNKNNQNVISKIELSHLNML